MARKNGYFTLNRDRGYNVLRAQVELKQWQAKNDELAPAKFRFRAYEKCFFRYRSKGYIILNGGRFIPEEEYALTSPIAKHLKELTEGI